MGLRSEMGLGRVWGGRLLRGGLVDGGGDGPGRMMDFRE